MIPAFLLSLHVPCMLYLQIVSPISAFLEARQMVQSAPSLEMTTMINWTRANKREKLIIYESKEKIREN